MNVYIPCVSTPYCICPDEDLSEVSGGMGGLRVDGERGGEGE